MMQTMTGPDLLDRLHWRYAVKKFDTAKKVSDADWRTLEQALVLAPSSYGLQPWRAIVVRDPALRKELRAAAWNQPQIEEASHLVVFAARKTMTAADIDHFIALTAQVRGVPAAALDGYKQMMVGDLVTGPRAAWIDHWTARQAYIALGVLLTSAAALGIDACPMEGFVPDQFDKILGLPAAGLRATVIATVGYRAADDGYAKLAKVRFPAADLIEHR